MQCACKIIIIKNCVCATVCEHARSRGRDSMFCVCARVRVRAQVEEVERTCGCGWEGSAEPPPYAPNATLALAPTVVGGGVGRALAHRAPGMCNVRQCDYNIKQNVLTRSAHSHSGDVRASGENEWYVYVCVLRWWLRWLCVFLSLSVSPALFGGLSWAVGPE